MADYTTGGVDYWIVGARPAIDITGRPLLGGPLTFEDVDGNPLTVLDAVTKDPISSPVTTAVGTTPEVLIPGRKGWWVSTLGRWYAEAKDLDRFDELAQDAQTAREAAEDARDAAEALAGGASGFETTSGAQDKADAAAESANAYTNDALQDVVKSGDGASFNIVRIRPTDPMPPYVEGQLVVVG